MYVFLTLEIVNSKKKLLVYLVFGMELLVKTDGGGRKGRQQGLEERGGLCVLILPDKNMHSFHHSLRESHV